MECVYCPIYRTVKEISIFAGAHPIKPNIENCARKILKGCSKSPFLREKLCSKKPKRCSNRTKHDPDKDPTDRIMFLTNQKQRFTRKKGLSQTGGGCNIKLYHKVPPKNRKENNMAKNAQREKVTKKTDKKVFRKTAVRTVAINDRVITPRGGIRL